MSASSYEAALRRLLVHEGGYGNHPSDPGGPTNFGITIADYRRYVNQQATASDVRAMRIDEAMVIYRERYWNALRCDELPAGLDYAVFDYGVNSGIGRAAKVLRRLIGLPEHGGIDDAVVAAIRGRDAAGLIARLCDERLAFLKQLKTWPVFGVGWGRRVAEVRAASLAMAARSAVPQRTNESNAGKAAARNAAAGGVVAAGAAAAQQAHQAGAQLFTVVAIVVATAAIAAGAWLAWRWLQRRRVAA